MSAARWRIVFFGTPEFALPSLERLTQGPEEVVAVVTQPDREKGRGKKRTPPPVKTYALQHGLSLYQPEKVKEASFLNEMKALGPDLMVVVAFGQILPKGLLEIPRFGAINVHGSLLPAYRGAAPVAWALLRGEEKTGVTTMLMDEGMDTGDILLQAEVAIEPDDTRETLEKRLALRGSELLTETIEKMKKGELTPVPQDHSKATYAPPLKKEDGRIDWRRSAREIENLIRAMHPWPGAFTRWERGLLKILRGEARQGAISSNPGTVLWVGADFIEVGTGEGSLLIKEVQPEGGRRMSVRDFLAGHRLPSGLVFL
ncbi:MAG: methionyl-tRNA formyltransferase [Desulfobacterota bacterium]|nr:methionyl-tRNA formyltransferase [Thermodesulfobacteriota bacterium]